MRIIREFRNFNKKIFESKENCPFLFTDSSTDGDFFQAILDVGFSWWEDDNSYIKTYAQMIYKMEDDFGYNFALLILLGKYNHQVGNGGHIQYFDNGFASVGRNNKDIELHEKMIEWFEDAKLDDNEIGKRMLDIFKESGDILDKLTGGDEICEYCDGDGEVEETCPECGGDGVIMDNCSTCDGEGEVDGDDCPECDGSGEVEIECTECGGDGKIYNGCEECDGSGYINPTSSYSEYLDRLDTKYYEIEGVEEYLNEFAKNIIIEKYPDEWEKFKIRINAEKYNI